MTDARKESQYRRLQKLFLHSFTADLLAEPLCVCDADSAAGTLMELADRDPGGAAGVSDRGRITGYVEFSSLKPGSCRDNIRDFADGQLLPSDASFSEVILTLDRFPACFITALGIPVGLITRNDILKPAARMWMFGMLSIWEMFIMRLLEQHFPGDSWREHISAGRIEKAEALKTERARRKQQAELLDCLQFGDKVEILISKPEIFSDLGLSSMRQARELVKDLQSFRNNLAHAQDIVTYDWPIIVLMAKRVSIIVTRV